METTIGSRIREFRELRGLTQEKLAELCDVSPSCVSRWERNDIHPKQSNMALLAQILEVDIGDFYETPTVPIPENRVIQEVVRHMKSLDGYEQLFILKVVRSYIESKGHPV